MATARDPVVTVGAPATARAATGASPAAPAIRVERLRVAFDGRSGASGPLVALNGISLAVHSREVVAIIGPNGSGKSTLLRAIGGLQPATDGIVEVLGRRVTGPDPSVGFVFQEPRLLPWRTARDNIAFPLELAGVPAEQRAARARELLHLVGLERFAEYRPHELSGGMRQRAAIARALAFDPEILLLDEPFSALDALTRERFDVELSRLWQRMATTSVIVTHDIREALFLADRVLVLSPRPGQVVGQVVSPLPRPRGAELLDDRRLGEAARAVRRLLVDDREAEAAAVAAAAAGRGQA